LAEVPVVDLLTDPVPDIADQLRADRLRADRPRT